MKQEPPYTIDWKAGTITYLRDRETGETQTERIEDLVDLLFWLRRRESVLRSLVFHRDPIPPPARLQLKNGYYVGVTREWQRVKVAEQVLREEITRWKQRIAQNWMADQIAKERRSHSFANVDIVTLDTMGNPIPPPPPPTEDDVPPFLLQPPETECMKPEYWVLRRENLDAEKVMKLE